MILGLSLLLIHPNSECYWTTCEDSVSQKMLDCTQFLQRPGRCKHEDITGLKGTRFFFPPNPLYCNFCSLDGACLLRKVAMKQHRKKNVRFEAQFHQRCSFSGSHSPLFGFLPTFSGGLRPECRSCYIGGPQTMSRPAPLLIAFELVDCCVVT